MPFKLIFSPVLMAWLLAPMVGFLFYSLATSEAEKWAQIVAFFVLLTPFIWSWLPQWDEWLNRKVMGYEQISYERLGYRFKQPYADEGLLKPIVFYSYFLIELALFVRLVEIELSGGSINGLLVSMIFLSGLVISLVAYFFEDSFSVFYHRLKK